MDLSKQYNDFAQKFSDAHDIGKNSNRDNRKVFYECIDFVRPGMTVLDLGCGDGLDLVYYRSLGAEVFGLDASDMIKPLGQVSVYCMHDRIGIRF